MLSKLSRHFRSYHFFILLLLFFSYLLLLVFNIKSLLILVIALGLILFFCFDFSLKEILFILTLFIFSFEKGIRGWNIPVVSAGKEWWMYGYEFYYGLSLRSIFIFSTFILYIPDIYDFFGKLNGKFIKNILITLVFFVLLALISTFNSSDYFLSFFGFLRIIQAVCLFFVSLMVVRRRLFREYIFISLVIVLSFNSFLAIKQFLNGAPIGFFLEDALGINLLGFFTSDGSQSIYRTSGFIGHPTFFASYMSMLIVFTLTNLIYFFKKKLWSWFYYFSTFSFFLGLFALYTTFVRSSWLSVAILILLFVFLIKKQKLFDINFRQFIKILGSGFLFMLIFGKQFILRLYSLLEVLTSGSGVVRILLIDESVKMIKSFPILGVGLNLSPRMMLEQSFSLPALRGFVFPVHNTFVLFFSELGIPATILFIMFLALVLFYSFDYLKNDMRFLGIWLGVLSFIFNAQVHTLFSQDPSFDLLFLFLGILSFLCIKKNKLL